MSEKNQINEFLEPTYNKHNKEVDKFFNQLSPKIIKQIKNIDDFLMIALFDIWLCNEDRYFGNPNLLLNTEDTLRFVPIDHTDIFSSRNLHLDFEHITYDESILKTEFAKKLFTAKNITNDDFLRKMEKNFYFCVEKCYLDLDTILAQTPSDWLIDTINVKKRLSEKVFSGDWK